LITTHLLSLRDKFRSITGKGEREKSGASFGEDFLYWFELSLDIVLEIYDKEVFAGFSSPRGFPRIKCCVSYECVFLSDLVLILLLSIEMQRTIIMS
jgi:hypothetical protein